MSSDAAATKDEYHLPHGSVWPPVLGLGVLFLYFGLAMSRYAQFETAGFASLGLGLIVIAIGLVGWINEDSKWWHGFTSTGAGNGWWGIILFLGTEIMLFGALFATFFNGRGHAAFWGPPEGVELPVGPTTINTLILISSGVTVHLAQGALAKGNMKTYKRALLATIILGAIFLAGQVNEYVELFQEGMTPGTGMYASTFFALTGTHGLHVFGGIIALTMVYVRTTVKGDFTQKRHEGAEMAAIYWHFVDVVWVVLFAVVYLGAV
ncbi:MAG: heme-copper oxidase subunit III [Euryarchaeota archaeon]|nr:heme-copper oxidase subunit III [Euryarchaeota archaeon]